MPENLGPAAAPNAALRYATAPWVAYLDCDDEYRPQYLGQVVLHAPRADVLVFGYDLIRDDESSHGDCIGSWIPRGHRSCLFAYNIVTPLGMAHRRDLLEQVGGFDERFRFEEDWDLWKRFALVGADFLYLPLKSGIYHIRERSSSRAQPWR